VACHSNHEIHEPTAAMLSGPNAGCAQCHDATSVDGMAAAEVGRDVKPLEKAIQRSDKILATAQQSGMEVSEALLRQREAKEDLVKAAVAVHAFQNAAVHKPIEEGLKPLRSGTPHSGSSSPPVGANAGDRS